MVEAVMDEAVRLSGRGRVASAEHGGGDLLLTLIEGPVVIGSAGEMGTLLWTASPGQARRFAMDSHERACERGDDGVTAFWRETLDWLVCREAAA